MAAPGPFTDFTTALVLCPPEEESKVIQAIRADLDKSHVDLWPAHVSLIYPFVSVDDIRQLLPAMQAAATSIEPFQVRLERFSQFNQRKRGYVTWLAVEPEKAVVALCQKLWQTVADAKRPTDEDNEDNKGEQPRFQFAQPHLTVARGQKESQAVTLQQAWQPLTFTCDKVQVLVRDNNKSPMKVLTTLRLGKKEVQEAATAAAV
jgi:2'-5' RNA ligase